MAKRVQLVLRQDISKLGHTGDLVEVAPGYARNYLLPQKLAVHVTPGILKQVERRREAERQRLLELKQEALKIKTTLEGMGSLTIAKQSGETETLFGSVTDREVAALILEKTGQEIDRRDIDLPEVRHLGTYTADIKLHPEVSVSVTVEVIAE